MRSSSPSVDVVTNPDAVNAGAEPLLEVHVRLVGGGFRIYGKIDKAVVTKRDNSKPQQ